MASIQRRVSDTSRCTPGSGFSIRAAAHVLVADAARHYADALRIAGVRHLGELLHHRVGHVFQDFVERFQLVVVRVDVDDRELVVVALLGLLRGLRQHFSGVELVDLHAAVFAERQFHHGVDPWRVKQDVIPGRPEGLDPESRDTHSACRSGFRVRASRAPE
jgi:hypothetical protein